ncbi:MAG: uracil-DNA glycosylase [Clostridiales bacterium]|nr:uracil-DNA glycosylase [Clostridiales bacterium]
MESEKAGNVNCFQCIHFAVTWEPQHPKSCKLFGFKSAALPSVTVYESTGSVCLGFEKKEAHKKGS